MSGEGKYTCPDCGGHELSDLHTEGGCIAELRARIASQGRAIERLNEKMRALLAFCGFDPNWGEP